MPEDIMYLNTGLALKKAVQRQEGQLVSEGLLYVPIID